MKTDDELKRLLATMLPDKLKYTESQPALYWWAGNEYVRDSELLHVCRLIEQTLDHVLLFKYVRLLHGREGMASPIFQDAALATSPWQQRTTALAQVKGLL